MKTQRAKRKHGASHPALTVFTVLCATIVAAAAATADTEVVHPPAGKLWQNAAEYLDRHQWLPGKVTEHEKTYNLKGDLEEETRFVLGLEADRSDGVRLRLISAEENGRDITVKTRSVIDSVIPLDELVGATAFTPTSKHQVTSSPNGQRRRINGHQCIGFAFRYRTADATVEGTAWLQQKTGLPVEINSRTTSVPFMEEDMKITAFEETESYTLSDEGHCLLDRTHVEMDIEIPSLNFKGHVTTSTMYTDHWEYAQARQERQKWKYADY